MLRQHSRVYIYKRNPDCQPITVENLEEVTLFFQKIVDWVDEWCKSKKAGLSTETFKSFHQTSTIIPLLAHHLLHEHGFEYVLTGKIQSDFLEKRFGCQLFCHRDNSSRQRNQSE